MNEITLHYPYRVNPARLSEDLQAALGEVFAGISTQPDTVRVFLNDDAPFESKAVIQGVLEAHDARELSGAEVRERETRDKLRDLRQQDKPLHPQDYADAPELLRQLAIKVALLEAMLRDRL
jgi:hypothetical protein